MVETTQLNKYGQRQKRARNLANKKDLKSDSLINTYFYPKNNLYTRKEFELLDSIYSDDPPTSAWEENATKKKGIEDFWPQVHRQNLGFFNTKKDLIGKISYLITGVMLTSVIWLIYLQFHDYHIRTKNDTQIVFQKSAEIITHKTADKQITSVINSQQLEKNSQLAACSSQLKNLFNWFPSKPKVIKEEKVKQPNPQQPQAVKYHTVTTGDSLWTIANKHYSDPSPTNIEKIMKANNMKRIGILSIGQKIVIP